LFLINNIPFADVPLQKLKQKYNNPRSLSTRVNLQDLSQELRLRPPYVLCEEELRPGYGQKSSTDQYKSTTGNALLFLLFFGII
jgi:hypothetical protein